MKKTMAQKRYERYKRWGIGRQAEQRMKYARWEEEEERKRDVREKKGLPRFTRWETLGAYFLVLLFALLVVAFVVFAGFVFSAS